LNILFLAHHIDLPEAHLIASLPRYGFKPHVMLAPSSPFLNVLSDPPVSTEFFTFTSRLSLSAIKKIQTCVSDRHIQIIHSLSARGLSNSLMARGKGQGVRQVAYRGTVGHLSRFDPSSWLSYLHPKLDAIVCVSEAVRDYLLSMGIAETKLFRIYKGHDPAWYKPLGETPEIFNAIPKGCFLVSCTANMRPVKGVDILLRALDYLPPNIHLLLIGEVRHEEIRKLAGIHTGRVHFTGFQRDVVSLVARSHLFVMPSREREGLPKAVIEAMCLKIPSVVSNVGGLPELVSNEKCGLVVPPSNPESLANAIRLVYENPELRRSFGEAGYRRIEEKFSQRETQEATATLYRSLLSSI
jgi:glycosyltransferase involved in cell wall biosynthesis